jgi:hypothetical protein
VLDDAAFGAATPVVPKFISPADPAARGTGANGGLAFFAYCTNYLIDLNHAVIMDVEATTAVRQAEVTAQRRMIERTEERFDLWPERLPADAGYGSAENWCTSTASRRTSRCSTSPAGVMAASHVPTSPTIMDATSVSAPEARNRFTSDARLRIEQRRTDLDPHRRGLLAEIVGQFSEGIGWNHTSFVRGLLGSFPIGH